MAKKPLRVTGFTRFFIVMLLVAPLAYIGASYYNGEDGIEKIKSWFDRNSDEGSTSEINGENVKTVNQSPNESTKILEMQDENRRLKEELEYKSKRVDELYRDNEALRRKLESLEKTLNETKGQ